MTAQMLVLENLAFPFVHPNILDVKLGRQLYDHEASEEKRIRMERVSRETTSGSDSLRICGFKVGLSSSHLASLHCHRSEAVCQRGDRTKKCRESLPVSNQLEL